MLPQVSMGKRLRVKNAKRRKDQLTAFLAGTLPARHKVAFERSRKARLKKANTMD